MKDIQLHRGHAVEIALDHFDGHPMPRNIQMQPAPGKAGVVLDVDDRRFQPCGVKQSAVEMFRGRATRPRDSGRIGTRLLRRDLEDGSSRLHRVAAPARTLVALDDQRRGRSRSEAISPSRRAAFCKRGSE